jgi:hypothetical protein
MSDAEKTIQTIIQKLRRLPSSELEKVGRFMESLDPKVNDKQKILAYVGAWKDIDPAIFGDLTDRLTQRREQASSSRRIF